MNKSRYSERDYLCDYDLSLEFFNELGIKPKDVTPLRKVFMLKTDEGNKILKKVSYDESKVDFISYSLEYVKNKYKNIISYNKLKNNLNYIRWNNNIYIVMDILDGRESSFSNPVEIKLCANNIALMHNASKGLREDLINKYNKDFLDESFTIKCSKAHKELEEMKRVVNRFKYRNEFDELFIEKVDFYITEIENVQDMINNSAYEKLRNDGSTIVLCHNDLAYHNFLIKNEEVNIIDFDFMTLDLRIMDISDFLLKSIKNAAFDINKMITVIEGYEEVSLLSNDEKRVLHILLTFPRDFFSITTDYYYKRKKWDYDVYLNRFKLKLENDYFRHEFLEEYKKIYNI